MARPLRIEYPGAHYHVMNRGNAQEDIFKSERDRTKFLEYLERAVERFSIRIHTYCLMTNHYHLLIETPEPNLSAAIQWINVSYASYFNIKRKRSGHLFQGRFKSILIEADEYLTHLSRYIHLNPLRAKMVKAVHEYRWSSYPAFIEDVKPPKWLELNWILSGFGKKKKAACQKYKEFVEGVDFRNLEDPGRFVSGGFILGDAEFVKWVKKKFISRMDDNKEIPQLKILKPRISPEMIVNTLCEEFKCSDHDILTKGRKINRARDIAVYLAKDNCGMKIKDIGTYFGNATGASITMTYNRFHGKLLKNRRLKGQVNRIENRIFKF
ncbi:MAG: transposase [Promethearchaeota archaeon]